MLDFYQVGALLYELLTGLPPNYSSDKKQLFSNIAYQEPLYPNYLSPDAVNLLKGLLEKDPDKRMGVNNDWQEIKNHVFFEGL